jgi:hypothetical protein
MKEKAIEKNFRVALDFCLGCCEMGSAGFEPATNRL